MLIFPHENNNRTMLMSMYNQYETRAIQPSIRLQFLLEIQLMMGEKCSHLEQKKIKKY